MFNLYHPYGVVGSLDIPMFMYYANPFFFVSEIFVPNTLFFIYIKNNKSKKTMEVGDCNNSQVREEDQEEWGGGGRRRIRRREDHT